MINKKLEYRDVSVSVYLQVRALSNISKCLSENTKIDKCIEDLLKEFKSYNSEIKMDFIKQSIFNTSTCMYVLYFFVCCATEYNLIRDYNMGEEKLCDIIQTEYNIKMIDFTRFLRNAIAHLGFTFYENGNLDIYNNSKVEYNKIILKDNSNIKDVFEFLNDKNVKNIKVNLNENQQYEIVEQKYSKEIYKFTHEQFLTITAYYTEKFCKSIMHIAK
ncbi:MAG: hypothetical protein IJV94_04555 [Bacilli bacterium]|nr:hypothetical protein [Bacilli bacterium]